jgi:hypothetical protein
MKWFVLIAATVLPGTAYSHPVVDRAITTTLGCNTKQDLLDVLKVAAATSYTGAIEAKKIGEYKCFVISRGQLALTAPEWQQPYDMFGGIILFHEIGSGKKFYAHGGHWLFIRNVY